MGKEYTEGRIPTMGEDRYLSYVNNKVFTEAFDADWLSVVDNSKSYIQLCAKDTVKFNDFFLGKDSLFKQTMNAFPDYGFMLGKDKDLGAYVALPRFYKMKEKGDYVVTPVWLIAKLLDEKFLDPKKNVDRW